MNNYPINKKIVIIYTEEDTEIANDIYDSLITKEFQNIKKCPLTPEDTIEQYYNSWWADMPQLAITINLAGFEWRNTGGNSMYSMLGFNLFHYINKDIPNEKSLLFGLIPITMRFICDTTDHAEHIHATYRRIHDITYSPDVATDIPDMLKDLEWRK